VFQQAIQSEADELQIALQTGDSDVLETYLQKYPDSPKQSEIQQAIDNLKRSEFAEWTLYEIGDQHLPQYFQLSSIQKIGDRGVAKTKLLVDSNKPKIFFGKSFPDAAYQETINVYDCATPRMASSEDSVFSEAGELLFHYKWGDPRYLNLSTIGFAVKPGSIGYVGRRIVCDGTISAPLVSKKQMASMNFTSLSSTNGGEGEIFYRPAQKSQGDPNQIEITTVLKYSADHNVNEFFPVGTSIQDPPSYRAEVDRLLIRCDANRFAFAKTEYWNLSNQLVRMVTTDPAVNLKFVEMQQNSPFAALQEIFCQKAYAGIGIRIAQVDGSTVAAEVFEGSPAAKAGVAANDIIFQVDNEAVSGFTPQQITEKIRGPENTKVALKVLRKGQNDPIEFSIIREILKMKSVEGAPK
jgi:hypothetical protein